MMILSHQLCAVALLATSTLSRWQFIGTASAFCVRAITTTSPPRLSHCLWSSLSDEIRTALENDCTTILDVRRPDEILGAGYWKAQKPSGEPRQWINLPCTPKEAELLEMTASNLLTDKSAPVVVHCASGKRAAKAKQVLDDLGYEVVLNAGGWDDVQQFQ